MAAGLSLPGVRRADRQHGRRGQVHQRRVAHPGPAGLAITSPRPRCCPYRQFHDVARKNFRYDVERLSAFYSVSYETIAHRLSTLHRQPTMRGVPFSETHPGGPGRQHVQAPVRHATGFHFSSSWRHHAHRLWNVYETFRQPGARRSGADRPDAWADGRNYMWVARTVERRAARYMVSPVRPSRSGWAANFATHTGSSTSGRTRRLSGDPGKIVATPIGAGCRVCERDSAARSGRFPRLGRAARSRRAPAAPCPRILVKQRVTRQPSRSRSHRTSMPQEFRQLGPINWVHRRRSGARAGAGAPEMHLFTTLGQRQAVLFWAWAISQRPAAAAGRLPRDRHRIGDPARRASAHL